MSMVETLVFLIGKRGQTLEAIQYIIEKIVNKRNQDRIRVQVDSKAIWKKDALVWKGWPLGLRKR